MKSLFRFILSICVMLIALDSSFRILGAMMVHDDATVILESDACQVITPDSSNCTMKASVSHSLFTSEHILEMTNGTVMRIADSSIKIMSYDPDRTRYEPFGKFASGAIGIGILLLGSAFAGGLNLIGYLSKFKKFKS